MEIVCLCSMVSGVSADMITQRVGGDFHHGGTGIIWRLFHSNARRPAWDDLKAVLSWGIDPVCLALITAVFLIGVRHGNVLRLHFGFKH